MFSSNWERFRGCKSLMVCSGRTVAIATVLRFLCLMEWWCYRNTVSLVQDNMLPFFRVWFHFLCSTFLEKTLPVFHIPQKSLTCNSSSQCGTWRLLWTALFFSFVWDRLCPSFLAQYESSSVNDKGVLEQPASAWLGAELWVLKAEVHFRTQHGKQEGTDVSPDLNAVTQTSSSCSHS